MYWRLEVVAFLPMRLHSRSAELQTPPVRYFWLKATQAAGSCIRLPSNNSPFPPSEPYVR